MKLEDRSHHQRHLAESIRVLADLDPKAVVRPDLPETFRFDNVQDEVLSVVEIARLLRDVDLLQLPATVLSIGAGAMSEARSAVEQLLAFDLGELAKLQKNSLAEHSSIQQNTLERLSRAITNVSPLLSFIGGRMAVGGHEKQLELERYFNERAQAVKELSDGLAEYLEMERGRVDEMVKATSQAVQRTLVQAETTHFHDQAEEHLSAGRWWLGATGLGVLGVGIFAWRTYARVTDPSQLPVLAPSQVAQFVTGKALLFSALASVTLWCGRIYKAHRHNYVVNRHRQNALSSFDAFAKSATDPATRDTVLVQATNAIFAPQHSGFGSTESDPTMPAASELLKAAKS